MDSATGSRANISIKTANMSKRFTTTNAQAKLEKYYPQINKIISILCNANYADDIDILNFLMGKKPLEECGFLKSAAVNQRLQDATNFISSYLPSIMGEGGILEIRESGWAGDEHYIKQEIADCLNEVLNGGLFGIWFDAKGSADKLHQLYLQTDPKKDANVNFCEFRRNGTFPIKDKPFELNGGSRKQYAANVAFNVANAISETNRYDHWKFNQLLGIHDSDLLQLGPNDKLKLYFEQFGELLGIPVGEVPSYLEEHPITIVYDQVLTNMASEGDNLFNHTQNSAPQMSELTQLCALGGSENYQIGRLVKYGAITSIPGVFVFGTKGCQYRYDHSHVHFGENIHVMGLRFSHVNTDVYAYYKRLYGKVIEKACAEGKIDHLVLNSVEVDYNKQLLNAIAQLDALIEHKDLIIQNGMKIILINYYWIFGANGFSSKLFELSGIQFKFLSGEDADLQGQALAKALDGSKYVGMVNETNPLQYGGNFLTMLGDDKVEERIWNQLFFGPHYDAVVAGFPDELEKFIHIKYV
jgi:hypothetical protein